MFQESFVILGRIRPSATLGETTFAGFLALKPPWMCRRGGEMDAPVVGEPARRAIDPSGRYGGSSLLVRAAMDSSVSNEDGSRSDTLNIF
jgi:hypothetical protein